MSIHFTQHARDKFKLLKKHNFPVTKQQVLDVVQSPDVIDDSRLPLHIAQKSVDDVHVLRVVYKQEGQVTIIITFYPGRKSHYEK